MVLPRRELERVVAADRQAPNLAALVTRAILWVLMLSPTAARRRAGLLSCHVSLRDVQQDLRLPARTQRAHHTPTLESCQITSSERTDGAGLRAGAGGAARSSIVR